MRFIKYNSFKRPIRLSLYLYLGSRKMHQEIQPKVHLEKNGRDFKIVFITDVASEPHPVLPWNKAVSCLCLCICVNFPLKNEALGRVVHEEGLAAQLQAQVKPKKKFLFLPENLI